MTDEPRFVESSGNVFADLGMDDPEELMAKAQLAHAIAKIIERHGWTQTEAARVLGISQSHVSRVLRGQLDGFSTERLFRFLNTLGQNIEIVVSPKPVRQDHASITVSTVTPAAS